VDKNFSVTELGEKDGLQWVTLAPKIKDTDFQSVRLGFKGDDVMVMELTDSLGNTTRITFSHVQRNVAVADDVFQFTPPAGADVIGDTGGKPHD